MRGCNVWRSVVPWFVVVMCCCYVCDVLCACCVCWCACVGVGVGVLVCCVVLCWCVVLYVVLCCVLCCVCVCWCVWCVCVGLCVVCGAAWHAENPRVYAQNVSVCRFKTHPYVRVLPAYTEAF